MLFVACCLLCAGRRSLFAVRCVWLGGLLFAVCCLLFVGGCLLFVVCCRFSAVCCLMRVAS